MEAQNYIPETDGVSDSGSSVESSKLFIKHPESHMVRDRVASNIVKLVLIYPDGEQDLWTFDICEDWTLQDLLDEISDRKKAQFSRDTECYLETDLSVGCNYIVLVAAMRCSNTDEDGKDSDGDVMMICAKRKNRHARILSSPEGECNSPRPPIEISDERSKEKDKPLKVAPERPEPSKVRKAQKRRATDTGLQTDEFALPSDEDQIEDEFDKSEETHNSCTPANSHDNKNERETETMLDTEPTCTNPSSTPSEPPLSYNEIIEGGGGPSEIQNIEDFAIQGPHTFLMCKMVRIGSHHYTAQERIIISQNGVRFSAPLVRDNTSTVILEIKLEDILKVLIHFGDALPVIFIYVRPPTANSLRDWLGMQNPEGPWYSPTSQDDTQRTMMFWLEIITEESQMILKSLFSPNKVISEMSINEAKDLLLGTSPKSMRQDKSFIRNLGVYTGSSVSDVAAGKIRLLHKEPKRFVNSPKPDTSMVEDRKNGSDETVFKKPGGLMKRKKEKTLIVDDDQKEINEMLLSTSQSPIITVRQNTPRVDDTDNRQTESFDKMYQNVLEMFGLNTSTVEDIETGETEERVEKDSSLNKKSNLNTSRVDATKNTKTETFSKKHQIATKRSNRNTSKIHNTENKKIETLPKKQLSLSRRLGPSDENYEYDEAQIVLVYPPLPSHGGIAVTVRDVRCLRKGEFLNDLIIDFYLKYLTLEVMSETDKERTHIFSIHFYKRLTSQDTSSTSSRLQPSAAQRHSYVKNWTKHVNIFEKDFIVVPINENAHWFLAIICFPGLVGKSSMDPTPNDEHKIENSSYRRRRAKEMKLEAVAKSGQTGIKKRPCILIFDSLSEPEIRYKLIISNLREYLRYEHRSRLGSGRMFSEETMEGACLKVPQQNNYSDCGLYVLQFVESFFSNPIKDYELPIESLEQWFDTETVSSKRKQVLKIIQALKHRNNSEIISDKDTVKEGKHVVLQPVTV